MKAMFEKLAHASIMRLNPASMDKLYDLMTMAVKHQVNHMIRIYIIICKRGENISNKSFSTEDRKDFYFELHSFS
jgi:hypothetical protein